MTQLFVPQKQTKQDFGQIVSNHEHTGSDGSKRLSLLDWKVLGRAELAVANTSLTLTSIPTRRFMKVFLQHGAKASNGNTLLRFNNDSSGNYSSISRENDTARTSATSIDLFDALNNTTAWLFVIDIFNAASSVKGVISEGTQLVTTAGTSQVSRKVYGSWVNTADAINRIDVVSSGGNLPVGSQILVMGNNY